MFYSRMEMFLLCGLSELTLGKSHNQPFQPGISPIKKKKKEIGHISRLCGFNSQ